MCRGKKRVKVLHKRNASNCVEEWLECASPWLRARGGEGARTRVAGLVSESSSSRGLVIGIAPRGKQ
ncbi:hypothetical protein JMJ77_0005455 [Colletotrichum scovillei]|uniref:Uncharacterized protein n=1 Tax=Colletotrichum scovillei TaxID=1209932 RepID=A0A9P7UIR6_9PEZI|nr:hypothetical protein JMJ77_0005455 [Colletotrichum scovillei]KAG7076653.1 hypothetical protein JMJ76_0013914 [Colletotrichum scovillei]KAG7083868.1 hypothetical protein JMJ78_0009309 [Colletotrichum scovillei]